MILIDGKEWRPVSFVDQLIRAILADDKTETRRIVRRVPYWDHCGRPLIDWALSGCYEENGKFWLDVQTDVDDNTHREIKCPYGKPGDGLWVRECFVAMELRGNDLKQCAIDDADCVAFRDGSRLWRDGKQFELPPLSLEGLKLRPPMHLPFWAHRIKLEVTSIGIERVQEITEDAAVREGFKVDEAGLDRSEREFDKLVCPQCGGLGIYPANSLGGAVFDADCSLKCDTARGKFRIKWDVINGKRIDKSSGKPFTWSLNPYVWTVGFKRLA